MRGFLLERHPRVTDMLACAFAHVGISLVRVTSLEALLDAADTAGPDEFLIIDLTMDGPDDLGRYAPVLGQAVVPVHTVYRDQAIPLLLAHAAASLVLLSVDTSWFALLDKLEALQRQAYVARLGALPLRQAQVLRLLGEGHSRAQIARRLQLAEGTVKEYVDRLERVLGVDRVSDLRAIARLLEPRKA